MGNVFGCIDAMSDMQRMKYDMTPIKNKKLPIIWLVGPPGTGRRTQAQTMAEELKYENIRVAELLRYEADKDTDRGRIVKEHLISTKKVPDVIVVDLIKEEMLDKVEDAQGFIINGFPRTAKQALLFTKEIGNVDAVIYLYSNTNSMITRVQQKRSGVSINPEVIKKDIIDYMKEAKEGTSKFSTKVEKIYTDAPVRDVYKRIENALSLRVNINNKLPTIETTSKLTVKPE